EGGCPRFGWAPAIEHELDGAADRDAREAAVAGRVGIEPSARLRLDPRAARLGLEELLLDARGHLVGSEPAAYLLDGGGSEPDGDQHRPDADDRGDGRDHGEGANAEVFASLPERSHSERYRSERSKSGLGADGARAVRHAAIAKPAQKTASTDARSATWKAGARGRIAGSESQ